MIVKGSRCPRCGAEMEYDGNYYCTVCPWALRENARGKDLDAFEVAYVLYMQQTGREPDPDVIRRQR